MIKELFRAISIWIIVLPLVAGIINYKGLNRDSRWIFFLVLVAFVPQILTYIIDKSTYQLNITYNIYTFIEMALLYLLFANKYQQDSSKVVVRLSVIAYLIITFFIVWRDGLKMKFLNDLLCVNHVIYMTWILLLLKEQYNQPELMIHKKNPFAWYLLALLIYVPGSVIAFALYHYMRGNASLMVKNLWIIHSVCNIILYILFTCGLFLRGQKKKIAF